MAEKKETAEQKLLKMIETSGSSSAASAIKQRGAKKVDSIKFLRLATVVLFLSLDECISLLILQIYTPLTYHQFYSGYLHQFQQLTTDNREEEKQGTFQSDVLKLT